MLVEKIKKAQQMIRQILVILIFLIQYTRGQQEKRGEVFIVSCLPKQFHLQALQADTRYHHLVFLD